MSRKTRAHKRSQAKKISNRKAVGLFAKFDRRTRIVAGMVLLPVFKKSPKQYRSNYTDEYWPW